MRSPLNPNLESTLVLWVSLQLGLVPYLLVLIEEFEAVGFAFVLDLPNLNVFQWNDTFGFFVLQYTKHINYEMVKQKVKYSLIM